MIAKERLLMARSLLLQMSMERREEKRKESEQKCVTLDLKNFALATRVSTLCRGLRPG